MARIAWLSPFPPLTTGVAQYAGALLPRIARRHEVTVYRDPKYIPEVGFAAPEIESVAAFAGREDLAVYHVGADWRSMEFLWEPLHRRPGLVVLHDFSLHDLAAGTFRGRPAAFLAYFLRHEGRAGLDALARDAEGRRRLSPRAWSERIRFASDRRERFPLNRGVLRRAKGVVVHSLWTARAVKAISPETRVFVVPHGATPTLTDESPAQARAALRLDQAGVTPDTFIVTLYGSLGGHKRIAQALGGVRLFLQKNKDADLRVIVAGRPTPEVDLATLVSTLGLAGCVHVAERARPLRDIHRLLRASNAYIGLRDPGLGATSGALVTALSVGTPTVVSAVPPLTELPASFRVPVGPGEEEAVARALEAIRRDPDDAARTGCAAAAWMGENCSWERAAQEFLDAISALLPERAAPALRPR